MANVTPLIDRDTSWESFHVVQRGREREGERKGVREGGEGGEEGEGGTGGGTL